MKRLLLAFSLVTSAAAQNPQDYDRYLIPVIQRNLPGANGSLWTSELLFRNRWPREMALVGPQEVFCTCLAEPVPPNTTTFLNLFAREGMDGAFLFVPKSLNDPKPAITLRVRDTSQNAASFGTEIHLPLPDEFRGGIDLIGIPTDARYRATLRIYGTSASPQQVRITTYASDDRMLDQQIVMLSTAFIVQLFPIHPAYAQLNALPNAVRGSGDHVRILIDTMGENVSPPPPPIWAFATVTDNVTQLTSTITPNR